jgi:hypothetical protein
VEETLFVRHRRCPVGDTPPEEFEEEDESDRKQQFVPAFVPCLVRAVIGRAVIGRLLSEQVPQPRVRFSERGSFEVLIETPHAAGTDHDCGDEQHEAEQLAVDEASSPRLVPEIGDGTIDVSVHVREDAAQRFSRIWNDIRER